MAEVEFFSEPVERMGRFDGVEVLSLDVLDQRDFEKPIVRNLLDNDRYRLQAGKLGSSP